MGSENKAESPAKEEKKKGVAGIIVNIFIGIILVLVFIITLNIIISSVSGKGYNSMFGMAFLSVETDSMSKEGNVGKDYTVPDGKFEGFEIGDLIFVNEINKNTEFEKGDIITFYFTMDGETVINTHRIEKILLDADNKPANFTTRGDNSPKEDEYAVSISKVIGKYTGVKWAGIGHVGLFLKTAYGYWLVIGVPALIILIYCIISFVLAVTKRNKVELADEKEKIRRQIINEMRAEQGLPPLEAAPAAEAALAAPPAKKKTKAKDIISRPEIVPAEIIGDSIADTTAVDSSADDETDDDIPIATDETDDDIPIATDEDMDAAIERIRGELAANFGDPESGADEPAPKAKPAKPAAAKKPAAASTAKKPAAAAAKKPASTTAKKAATSTTGKTASASAKKPTASKSSPAAKPTVKKTTPSKSGLIGTGAPKKPASKKKTDE